MRTNVASRPGSGRAQDILGTRQVWKVESDRTGGTLVCVEIAVPPGAGVPPHRHSHEDETFYVVSGEIAFEGDECADGPVILGAGGAFHGPRGRLHAFRCEGPETAKLLVFVTPGAAIDAMFAEMAALADRQGRAVEPAQVVAICGRYGIAFPTA